VEEKSSVGNDPLSVSLYQMDLDRTLFLLRSYLRIRIQKVATFCVIMPVNSQFLQVVENCGQIYINTGEMYGQNSFQVLAVTIGTLGTLL